MAKSEIFVAGASAGGTEALRDMVAGLPQDFNASVLIVVHIGGGRNGVSYLPDVLGRAGRLPAKFASDGESVCPGQIYLARPDLHMTIENERLHVFYGPKENLTRPAINPLFRSAAACYGDRAAGIILSGNLDDGVAGLAEIKRRGGLAVVQDPETARFRGMPESALEYIEADYVLAPQEIGSLMAELARKDHAVREPTNSPVTEEPITLTCPECRGPLRAERQDRITEFRCRVGHIYSPQSLGCEHDQTLERALWAAIVALEESADIAQAVLTPKGVDAAARRRKQADTLRKMLDELHSMQVRALSTGNSQTHG
jgi:two-component system, chemotaxis family, protein-glutamate methylesterase/glutaminase